MSQDELRTALTFFKEKLASIEKRLVRIEDKQSEFTERFIKMDAKRSVFDFIIKNWWKILIVLMPLMFFFGEIALRIRQLVP